MSEEQANNKNKTQDIVFEKAREIWLAGLGVFASIEEEGGKLFTNFMEKGEEYVEKGGGFEKKSLDFIKNRKEKISHFIEGKLGSAFETMGLSASNEVKELNEKVDKLTIIVSELKDKFDQTRKTHSGEES